MRDFKIPENLYVTGFIASEGAAGYTSKSFDYERIAECRDIIRANFKKIKTYPEISSYHLKGIVETFMGGYISNGEFIFAMIKEGFAYKIQDNGPNCFFNLSKKSYNELRAKM